MHGDDKEKKIEELNKIAEDYKYGFVTDAKAYKKVSVGLDEDIVREISKAKDEPDWMLEFRLKALKSFFEQKDPNYGPKDRIKAVDPKNMCLYIKSTDSVKNNWQDVPENIKNTFNRLGIMEAEQKWLSGVSTQFESEVVYHNNQDELKKLGV